MRVSIPPSFIIMTNKTLEKNLNKVLHELKALRRDVSLFLPAEKISDYKNAAQIKKSLKRTMREYRKGNFATKL